MAFIDGNIIVRSCIMIVAVIYGPTPSKAMERLDKPPPEKMFKKPRIWLELRSWLKRTESMPGIGMLARILKATSPSKTKKIFLRRSGILNICKILFVILIHLAAGYFYFRLG